MKREEIVKQAWNFIANEDEDAKIIPDGKVDEGAEFLADFVEHFLILNEEDLK